MAYLRKHPKFVEVFCTNCNAEIIKKRTVAIGQDRHFCNRACLNEYKKKVTKNKDSSWDD